MAGVAVSNVTRAFGSVRALDNVSIAFDDGGFYALLGPSGSGKTTLLRMIAGFDYPDSGTISIGKANVEHVPVERREIGMVFQNYALFPNMSVFDNVAFGLSVRSVARREIGARVAEVLRLVQLEGYEARRPHQLSGGQRQRVALARAIVTRPRVLLLDEPLSALDKTLRVEMQLELRRIQREVGITTIFVTHDQEEALTMSDRIGILRDGRLVQEGPPEKLYHRPASVFAATFLGEANILRGSGVANGLRLADGSLVVAEENHIFEDGPAACAIRPERISIAPLEDRPAAPNTLSARLLGSVFAGANIIYLTEWNGQPVKVVTRNDGAAPIAPDTIVELSWTPGAVAPVKDC